MSGSHGSSGHYLPGGDDGIITGSGHKSVSESSNCMGDGSAGYIHDGNNNTVGSRREEKGGHSRRRKVF